MTEAELSARMWEERTAMMRLAMAMMRHWQDAEDAVSDAMVKAYAKCETLRDEQKAKGWLLRITANACRDLLRRRRRVIPVEEIAAVFDCPEDGVYPQIMTLPGKSAEVLILYYYENMDTEEIARVLNIPAATVRARLSRGRKRLREVLANEEL